MTESVGFALYRCALHAVSDCATTRLKCMQGCSSEISFGPAGPKNSFCLLCSQYILIQTPVSALAFYSNTLHIFVTKKLTFTTIHNTHNDVPISININKTMNSPVIRSVTGFHT